LLVSKAAHSVEVGIEVPLSTMAWLPGVSEDALMSGDPVCSAHIAGPGRPHRPPCRVHYNRLDRGGHFAAWEQPRLFSEEIRASFRTLRK
jgi:hypothetical protein